MATLKQALKGKLAKKELEVIPASFDIIGSIAVFSDFPKELVKKERIIANELLRLNKNIKTVCKKTRKYSGKYRLPKLKIISGEKTKETVYRENNVTLKLDIEKVYFSPRLANERLRIAKLVRPGEDILVMFSGCAPFPCVISKNTKAESIIGVEINPVAHKYALENIRLNKLANVGLIKGDVKKVLPKKKFDRILMPLPKGAESYLGLALKKAKKGTVIHFYDFLNQDEFSKAKEKIGKACSKAKKKYKILRIVKCGQFAPKTYRVCADFKILN